MNDRLVAGVALDGAGAHGAAWRWPGAVDDLVSADRLVGLARIADAGGLDLVSLDDTLDPPPPGGPAWPRLDALLALARVAPATRHVGLLATVTTTHTEPFHVSKNAATLDLVSGGRAGWRVGVSTTAEGARRFGRKGVQPTADLYAEADDAIEVVTRLWDSWEDDAVIRDVATGRYVDRDKLHYIDFEGPFFSVRGPSITPRSPQGQPLVAIEAAHPAALALAARRADLVLLTAPDLAGAARQRAEVRHQTEAAGRDPATVTVLLQVRVGEPSRRAQLDQLGGAGRFAGLDVVGAAATVADTLAAAVSDSVVDGYLVAVDVLPGGLEWFVDEVASRWRAAGLLRPGGGTLRDRLGRARPANRYAPEVAS